MKTTSYKISKQLAEAGFKSWANFFWCELGEDLVKIHFSQSHSVPQSVKIIVAYDLETILEALPERLTNENIFISRINYYLKLSKEEIWYENECDCDSDASCPVNQRFELNRDKSESLADTAARLLILLHEKGLVNFNEEKQ